MLSSVVSGLQGLTEGVGFLFTTAGLKNIIMLLIGGVLIYLGVRKDVEPLLLVPIGFGCLLVNIPLSDLMHQISDGHRTRPPPVQGKSLCGLTVEVYYRASPPSGRKHPVVVGNSEAFVLPQVVC